MGWGGEHQGRGKPGEGLDLQERQGAIVGEGKGGGADVIGNSLLWSMHRPEGLEGGAALQRLQAVRSLLLI